MRNGKKLDRGQMFDIGDGHPPVDRTQSSVVSERADGALLAQFRADADSPKVLVLRPGHGGVEVETIV